MVKLGKKIGVLLILSLVFCSIGVGSNVVQATGMVAFDIGHEQSHNFVDHQGDDCTATIKISGHVIVAADRKSATIYYDVEGYYTNSFTVGFEAPEWGRRAFVNEQYFIPGNPYGPYDGWEINENFTYKPSGNVTYTFNRPISKIILSYLLGLKPDSATDTIFIAYNKYLEEYLN